MEALNYIEDFSSYEICKKFHKRIKPLRNYLVKTLGVDHSEGTKKIKRRAGKVMPRLRKQFSILLHAFLRKKKKSRRKKKKEYELAKSF